jgi:hypothetical protein
MPAALRRFAGFLWLGLVVASASGEVVVRAPAEGADAVPAIRAALAQAARDGAKIIRFEAGDYHLFRTEAEEQFLHIANHDDGLRRIAIPLRGWQGLRVEGGGARFIAHGHLIPFSLEDCRDVVLRDFRIDWAEPFFLQATVTTVDAAADAFEVEPRPESRAQLVDGQLLFGAGDRRNREGWWQNIEWSYWIDPATGAAAAVQPVVALWNARRQVAARAEAAGEGRFRLTHAAVPLPAPGSVLISKGNREENRISPAIRVSRVADLVVEDVAVHHAGGMGLIVERTENVTLRRFHVTPPPGSTRLVSTTADATHFVDCRGEILVEDCRFEAMLDDAINVHGVYGLVEELIAPDTVAVRLHHFQQLGLDFAEPGDVLRFARRDTLLAYGERTVRAVRRVNAQRLEIAFTEPLDGFLQPGSCIDNASWQARLVFRRNVVRNNRARSVLVTTGAPVLIEDNVFERPSMSSILVEGDTHFWHESGAVANLTIRRNVFTGLHPSAALLRLRPMQPGETRVLPPYHRHVTIEDNTFRVAQPLVLEAARVGGLIFARNRIEPLADATLREAPAVLLRACEDVTLRDNRFSYPTEAALRVTPDASAVRSADNAGLAPPR